MTYLCGEGHLDAPFQDVVGGYLYRTGQLQVLQNYVVGNLREHLLNLVGLGKARFARAVLGYRKLAGKCLTGNRKEKEQLQV